MPAASLKTLQPPAGRARLPARARSGRTRASGHSRTRLAGSARLDALLTETLARRPAPDGAARRVHVSAIASDETGRPRLPARTQDALQLIPLPERGQPELFELSHVTSVEFCVSALAHTLSWIGGAANGPTPRTTLDFPVIAAESAFAAAALLR